MFTILTGCASTPPGDDGRSRNGAAMPEALDTETYLQRSTAESRPGRLLEAAGLALDAEDSEAARALLALIDENGTGVHRTLLETRLALLEHDTNAALQHLSSLDLDSLRNEQQNYYIQALELRADAYLNMERYLAAARDRVNIGSLLSPPERAANNNRIWQMLSSAPAGMLSGRDSLIDSYELRGWLELLNVTQASQNHIEEQIATIEQWRARWANHSAATRLPDSLAFLVELWENRPTRIALLLPLQQTAGRAVSEGFMSAYYHSLSEGQDMPDIRIYDTSNPRDIPAAYQRASEEGADLVIGPLDKDAVRALQNRQSLPVPTLALNYGDENRINPANLYQFGLAPEDEIRQAANMAWQEGHRNATILTPAGADYQRIRNHFSEYWETLGGEIVSQGNFSGNDSYSDVIKSIMAIDRSEARAERVLDLLPRNNMEFIPRRRQDVDFIFLLASPAEGRQIIPTLGFHYAGDVPIYAMPSIHDGGSNPVANRDLNGIIFTDAPWLLSESDPLRDYASNAWPRASGPVERLRAMGVDAFRLYSRLAQLTNYPETRIQGATGTLSLQEDGSIRRHLLSARFEDGNVRLITHGATALDRISGGRVAGN